jgi:hypothetical protein
MINRVHAVELRNHAWLLRNSFFLCKKGAKAGEKKTAAAAALCPFPSDLEQSTVTSGTTRRQQAAMHGGEDSAQRMRDVRLRRRALVPLGMAPFDSSATTRSNAAHTAAVAAEGGDDDAAEEDPAPMQPWRWWK